MALGGIKGTSVTPSTASGKWNVDDASKNRHLPKDGSSYEQAAESARTIMGLNPNAPDGVYWINLPTVGPKQTYCLMNKNYAGGGWMLALKATRGTTFNYNSAYWTDTSTLNPTQVNRNDGDAKFDVYNYFEGWDMLATWPDITTSGGSIPAQGNWTWLESNYPGYLNWWKTSLRSFFGNIPQNFKVINGKEFRGFGNGIFSSQGGYTWYGFNYTANATGKVRWGFGWNNEGDSSSNDVFGGIGMNANSYSAGDYIACCQDQAGINRSARVEIWVR